MLHRALCILLAALVLSATFATPAVASDNKVLRGHVPAAVSRLNLQPTGQLAPDAKLTLALSLSLRDEATLSSLFSQMYDPASANYHHYLKPGEFAARFGPSAEDYQEVIDFAQSHGLSVVRAYSNRTLLDVSGKVSDIEKTFQVTLRTYHHPVENRDFYAPDTDPTVSAGLPVFHITGLDNYLIPHPMLKVKPLNAASPAAHPDAGSGTDGSYMGEDFRAAYAPGVALNGTGQNIALFELDGYYTNDILSYEQQAGLPNLLLTNVAVDGGVATPGGNNGEVALDIEMAISMATNASEIMVYEAPGVQDTLDELNLIASDDLAAQISSSWTLGDNPAYDVYYVQMAMQGQSFFQSSGDDGAYYPGILEWADDTNITLVGGTTLSTTGPAGAWSSETVWNAFSEGTGDAAGGGGTNINGVPIPPWQQAVSMANNMGSTTLRNVPDVALTADNVYVVYNNGQTGGFSGTSCAAPLWAGFTALINQQAAANGEPTVGFLNPAIYSIGLGTNYANCFHDVTNGNNTNLVVSSQYSAAPGYDLCTGWGTPRGSNLITALVGAPETLSAYNAVVSPASVICTNYQGWGTSLCWWANVVGGYTNRTNYCTLAFSQLKLNIVRYNIGGGENPALTDTITDYRAVMQGFEPARGIWNWNADENQRWVLQEAQTLGANLVDAFANSPPWWMTVSGSVTGNTNGADNLQVTSENTFAGYLSTVVSNLTVLDGDHFNYVTPMNEPVGTAWDYDNGKQEGCDMSIAQQSRVVGDLRSQLNIQAPSLGIDAAEDYSEQDTANDLDGYTNTSLGALALVTTHTYDANDAAGLHTIASSMAAPLWVAEYGDGDGTGLTMAQRIYGDLTQMKAQAWVYWQFVDSASGWGFLLNPLTTNSTGGFTTNYTINQKFYVMGQFSEFIQPGCNIISVNDSNTLAAYNPTNQTLALVMINSTANNRINVTYNLGAFASLPSQVAVYQTAGKLNENLTQLPSLPVTGGQFSCTNPPDSVTTFLLTNVTMAPVLTSGGTFPVTHFVTLYNSANLSLSVAALGTEPLYYQWFDNAVAIGGATSAVYVPPAANQSGTNLYFCVVTNVAGSVTGAVWSVSGLQEPFASYPQAVLGLQPIGYWRLDETPNNGSGNQGVVSYDYVGGNNGVYSNAVLGQAGYNPVTDPLETSTFFGLYASSNSDVGQIANIDFSIPLGKNAEYSISAWVNGSYYPQHSNAGIVAKGYLNGEELNLDEGAPGADFRFEVRSALGAAYNANSAINAYTDSGWHHLVGVCDEANSDVLLYVDGVLAGQAAIPPMSGITNSSSVPLTIGARASNATSGNNQQFLGKINDVAIYNYALSSNQVRALYAAAPIPVMDMTGSGNNPVINYTGTLLSSTNVTGPYTPVFGASWPAYTIPLTNSQMFYRVNNQQ